MSNIKDDLKYPRGLSDGTYMWVEKKKLDELVRELERTQKDKEDVIDVFEKFKNGDEVSVINLRRGWSCQWYNNQEIEVAIEDMRDVFLEEVVQEITHRLANYDRLPWYAKWSVGVTEFFGIDKFKSKIWEILKEDKN